MQSSNPLADFEREFPAQIFSTLGVNAWPHIKYCIATASVDNAVRLDTGNARQVLTWMGIKVIASSLRHLLHIIRQRRGRPAFFGASTGIAGSATAGFKDYYFPYYDLNPRDCQYFVNCGNLDHLLRHMAYVRERRLVVDNYLLAPWRKAIGLLIAKFSPSAKLPVAAMAEFLAKRKIPFSATRLSRCHAEFVAGTLIYSLLFKLTRPSHVYVVSAYSKCDLVAGARRQGIRVIEIQHGILGRFHPGYNHLDPAAGLGIPDQVDVYNQFWKEELLAGGFFRPDQIRIVGRLKYDELPPADSCFARTIVFTGQAAYRDELISRFRQWDAGLAGHGYKLLYVPHPKETVAERSAMRAHLSLLQTVELYEGTLTSEHLVKSAAAHLSLFSACHFDAVHLVGRTFVLAGAWSDFMRPYVEQYPDWFVSVENADEIIQRLGDKVSDNNLNP
jgi:hypothetical protein